ncbi:MAG: hypothetical protein IPJ19_11350 [Planctomycetes bacterium]|nr:hypothetical protein [Planctomycetota bacterium]
MPSRAAPATPSARFLLALGLLALLGLALRLWLAQGDLWLDEIWSWKLAREVHSPLEVWRVAHDNNHPLNTLWMHLLGDSAGALAYRALSIASGTVAVLCAGFLGARRSPFAGLACALLAATSTLLAYYSSEARGYAPAVACFLGGWLALERAQESGSPRAMLVWWLCAALGLCSHFTFVFGWAALAAGSLGRPFARVLKLHLPPAALVLAIYFGFVRGMAYGGGDEWSWSAVWIEALGWTFGTPQTLAFAVLGSLLLLGALLLERRAALVPALLLLAPPLATALILRPDFVALRYFSVPLAGVLILLGRALERLPRVVGLLLLALIALHNGLRDVQLARAGRGQFRAALEYMAAQTPAPGMTLSSDLPFDTRLTVEYHSRGLVKAIQWFQKPPAEGVDWWIVTEHERAPQLALGVRHYALARVFEAAGPSSYTWALYRRLP